MSIQLPPFHSICMREILKGFQLRRSRSSSKVMKLSNMGYYHFMISDNILIDM